MHKEEKKYYCDKCHKEVFTIGTSDLILNGLSRLGFTKVSPKPALMGIQVSMGYSYGGWGLRQDREGITAEVCEECFKKIETAYDGLSKAVGN